MEQVFDFREFMLTLLRKCRLIIILAVIFGVLGGIFGFIKGGEQQYMTTSGASVNYAKKTLETTPLTDTMKSIDSIIADNFFYTGLVNAVQSGMTESEYAELMGGKKSLKLDDMKNYVKVYTKGNIVLIDTTSKNRELSAKASHIGIQFVLERIPEYNQNVTMSQQSEQTVNLNEQQGNNRKSGAIKFGILGFGGGIVLAILWTFFAGVFDLRVKCASDLKKYRLPVLGELAEK